MTGSLFRAAVAALGLSIGLAIGLGTSPQPGPTLTVRLGVSPALAQGGMRIAAVVNEEVISLHDLQARLSLLIATSNLDDGEETRRRLAPQALRALIDDRLKRQEARRLDVQVTKSDIDGQMARIERQLGLQRGELPGFLARRGASPLALVDQIETEIAWVRAVRRRTRGQVRVGDDEVDDALRRMTENAGKPEVRLAEIFLPVGEGDREDDVRQLAERLISQLRQGARFPALARNFSQSPTAAVGGDMGWSRPEELSNEIREAVENLEPGRAIGEPVRTSAGYYVLLVINRRLAPSVAGPKVTVTLQQLFLPLQPQPTEEEIATQMQLAKTMSETATGCDDLEALGKEAGSPLSGSLGTVTIDSLPNDLRRVVEPLGVGETSPPVQSGNGVVVLMVCERSETEANADQREAIERMLTSQRLLAASRRILRDLRRAAFIDVRI